MTKQQLAAHPAEPTAAGPDAKFQQFLDQGEFRIQQCASCQRHIFYPRVLCPHCGSTQLDWRVASGDGRVHACSVVMGKPGTQTDYAVVLVDLKEGARMMSHVVDCDPHAVHIGMPLRARIVQREGGPLVVFAPSVPGEATP